MGRLHYNRTGFPEAYRACFLYFRNAISNEDGGVKQSLRALLQHPEFVEGQHWSRQRFAANQPIVEEGTLGSQIYLVLAGRVRVLGDVALDEGRRIRPGFFDFDAGEVFGELALFDREPRSASVVAVTDCELAVIDGDRLLAFLDRHRDLGYDVFKDLVSALVVRLRKTNRKLFSLMAWGLKAHGLDEHL